MSPGLSWFIVRQMRALRTAGPLIQLLGSIKMTVFNLAGYTAARLSPLYYIRLTTLDAAIAIRTRSVFVRLRTETI